MTLLLTVLLLALPAEISALCRGLKDAVKNKTEDQFVGLIDDLSLAFADASEKEQKLILKTLEGVFSSRKDSAPDVELLFITAAAGLSTLGPPGEETLLRLVKLKHVKRQQKVMACIIEGLAEGINIDRVTPILKLIPAKKPLSEASLSLAAAARGLTRYREAPVDVRKKIVEALVGCYAIADAQYEKTMEEDEPDENIEMRFHNLEMPILHCLHAMTGESLRTSQEWTEWWKTHGKKKWE